MRPIDSDVIGLVVASPDYDGWCPTWLMKDEWRGGRLKAVYALTRDGTNRFMWVMVPEGSDFEQLPPPAWRLRGRAAILSSERPDLYREGHVMRQGYSSHG